MTGLSVHQGVYLLPLIFISADKWRGTLPVSSHLSYGCECNYSKADKESKQKLVYFVSKMLTDVETRYFDFE